MKVRVFQGWYGNEDTGLRERSEVLTQVSLGAVLEGGGGVLGGEPGLCDET